LSSKSWETRIAAGHAVEAIASNVKEWSPPINAKSEGDDESSPPAIVEGEAELLSFSSFDIRQVGTYSVGGRQCTLCCCVALESHISTYIEIGLGPWYATTVFYRRGISEHRE